MTFDFNATGTVSSVSSYSIIPLIGTALVLTIIAVGGLYVLYSVEDMLRAHRFIRVIFTHIYSFCKYTFIGGIEVISIWLLYKVLELLAASQVTNAIDPILVAKFTGIAIVCFFIGTGTDRAVKRYRVIYEAAKQKEALAGETPS